MKQLLSVLMLICFIICNGQESTKKTSFLSRNQPVTLFSDLNSVETSPTDFKLKLPTDIALSQAYQSDFMSFMSNDTRLLDYPSVDLSQNNKVVFGNYMNTSFELGNSTFNTVYIFDQQGRLMNSRTSFSFGKKKN